MFSNAQLALLDNLLFAIEEQSSLNEIPFQPTSSSFKGTKTRVPRDPGECSSVLLRWESLGWIELYRWRPLPEKHCTLASVDARAALADTKSWPEAYSVRLLGTDASAGNTDMVWGAAAFDE